MTEKKVVRKPVSRDMKEMIEEKVDLKKGPAKWRDGLGGATALRTSAHRSDYREFVSQQKILQEKGIDPKELEELRDTAAERVTRKTPPKK